jgi:ribulose-phosphate 3-epimerase
MKTLIAPSILSCDFSDLGGQIRAVDDAGADWIHVDVMDGHFVPNITIGPLVVEAARRSTKKPLDVHLMIEQPDRYLADFASAGADYLVVHAETCPHLHRSLQSIRALGVKAGVAFNPATPVNALLHVTELVDMVLLMTVNPGFGGQKFIDAVLPKIRQVRHILDSNDRAEVHIQVDGGVAPDTSAKVIEAGADVLVAGSAIYGAPDYAAAIEAIRNPS